MKSKRSKTVNIAIDLVFYTSVAILIIVVLYAL